MSRPPGGIFFAAVRVQQGAMRQNACRLALAVLLAALLAPPAGGCLLRHQIHYQLLYEGPLPAADGNAWFALDQHDGSLLVRRLGDDGSTLAEVTLAADGVQLDAEPRVDGDGRFWVPGVEPDEDNYVHEPRLALFDAGGHLLAVDERQGSLFGVDRDGVAHLQLQVEDEEGVARVEIWHQDPLSGHRVKAFTLGLDAFGGDFHPVLAGDGSIWALTGAPILGPGGAAIRVLRRFSPGGGEIAAWRLTGEGAGVVTLHAGRGEQVVLAGSPGGEADLWVVDESGVVAHRRPAGITYAHRLVPLAGGGLLLRDGPEAVRLDDDGLVVARHAVAAVPAWAGWRGSDSRAAGHPVERLAHLSGAESERAFARLRDAGPEAVDLLVGWHAAALPNGGPDRGEGVLVNRVLSELMAADPDAVGARVTALLPHLDGDLRRRLTAQLAHAWPRPSGSFVALMTDGLASDHEGERSMARSVFLGFDAPGRFPASREVFDFFLAELAEAHASHGGQHGNDFFLPHFADVAPGLDAVLADPDHAARPAVVAWLERLSDRLPVPRRRQADLDDRVDERALATWALRWAASDDPQLAAAARLVAAAAGDAGSFAALPALPAATGRASDFLARLRARHPAAFDDALVAALAEPALTATDTRPHWRQRTLEALYREATPAQRAALLARLADPALPARGRRAAAAVFTPGTEAAGTAGHETAHDPQLVARLAATPRLLADLAVDDGSLLPTFLAFLWQHLENRPAERGRLEAAFRDACAAESTARRQQRNGGGSWEPTSCLRWAAASDVGRRVPDRLLVEHLGFYDRPEWYAPENRWLPAVVALEARRGPLPGFAGWIRREAVAAPDPEVGRDELTAALGELPEIYHRLAAMPVLELVPRP